VILFKGKDMRYAIPFGPFLCAAAIFYFFFGDDLTGLFLSFRI
jgi:prepilin signal peptidase PulO-like enzyme (type II secretory pathway)